jgi:hypothetical protein
MMISRFKKAAIVCALFMEFVAFGPTSAAAATWNQQVLLLLHIPLGGGIFIGGGSFITSNFVFTSTVGPNAINVKCFSDRGIRIGPPAGVNIAFSADGQVVQHTPTTLGVASDPLFSSGIGFCWANSPAPGADFAVQATYGVTTDLTQGGILNSSGSSFIGATLGSPETSSLHGGVPFWTTVGGAQPFLVIVNPLKIARPLSVRLFDVNGVAQGSELVPILSARTMVVLTIPSAFSLTSPPTSGSIRVFNGAMAQGFLGWYVQVYPSGRAIINPIGLTGNDTELLPIQAAP